MPVVGNAEGDDGRRSIQRLVSGSPSFAHRRRAQRDPSVLRELEGIAEQVLQHLLQARGVRVNRSRQAGIEIDVEVEAPVVRHLPEGLVHRLGPAP